MGYGIIIGAQTAGIPQLLPVIKPNTATTINATIGYILAFTNGSTTLIT